MTSARSTLRLLIATACGLAALSAARVSTSAASSSAPAPIATATLEQCLTAPSQAERSAGFAGEMTAIPGTARMEMRIEVLERPPGDALYHVVSGPGLGVWRASAPGVKIYTSIDHVTDLAAPAFYRGALRFRWLNAGGHVIKVEELRTARCEQPAPSPASGVGASSSS
jgi:hypothetical protein